MNNNKMTAKEKIEELQQLCLSYCDTIIHSWDVDEFIYIARSIEPSLTVTKELNDYWSPDWITISSGPSADMDFEATFIGSRVC